MVAERHRSARRFLSAQRTYEYALSAPGGVSETGSLNVSAGSTKAPVTVEAIGPAPGRPGWAWAVLIGLVVGAFLGVLIRIGRKIGREIEQAASDHGPMASTMPPPPPEAGSEPASLGTAPVRPPTPGPPIERA
ncbi:MAG: hypothetical protein ACREBT_04785 [Thermoplasmata archaeon]